MEDVAGDNLKEGGGGQYSHDKNDDAKNSPVDNSPYTSQNLNPIPYKDSYEKTHREGKAYFPSSFTMAFRFSVPFGMFFATSGQFFSANTWNGVMSLISVIVTPAAFSFL